MTFPKGFLIGAATAAHQVEGSNIHSDSWAMERIEHTSYAEPSGDAADHYHRYEEDIRLLADAGPNAYRFSIEWARIEPEEGIYFLCEEFLFMGEELSAADHGSLPESRNCYDGPGSYRSHVALCGGLSSAPAY